LSKHQINRRGQKHILIGVSWNKPQIVTETLFALMVKKQPPVHISDVYLFTTSIGKQVAWSKLGGPEGQIAKFCREYGFPARSISFDPDHIITIKRGNQELNDIRTTDDNLLVRSQLVGFVKSLTEDPHTVLHCAMGGGRRTMSAYMMLAMILWGRPDDTLTNVLIPQEFHSNSDFFFPPKKSKPIALLDAKGQLVVAETGDAAIELAEIQVPRLRTLLGERSKTLRDIDKLIPALQITIETSEPASPELQVNLNQGAVWFDDERVNLHAFRLALFAYLAQTKASYCVRDDLQVCGSCRECFQSPDEIDRNRFADTFGLVTSQKSKASGQAEEKAAEYRKGRGLDQERLRSEFTKINNTVSPLSTSLRITSDKRKGQTVYGLALDKNDIRIVPPANEK